MKTLAILFLSSIAAAAGPPALSERSESKGHDADVAAMKSNLDEAGPVPMRM